MRPQAQAEQKSTVVGCSRGGPCDSRSSVGPLHCDIVRGCGRTPEQSLPGWRPSGARASAPRIFRKGGRLHRHACATRVEAVLPSRGHRHNSDGCARGTAFASGPCSTGCPVRGAEGSTPKPFLKCDRNTAQTGKPSENDQESQMAHKHEHHNSSLRSLAPAAFLPARSLADFASQRPALRLAWAICRRLCASSISGG